MHYFEKDDKLSYGEMHYLVHSEKSGLYPWLKYELLPKAWNKAKIKNWIWAIATNESPNLCLNANKFYNKDFH